MAHRAILERDLTKLARRRTGNPPHSVAGHGDTLLISFPKLPPIKGDVIIYIVQAPPDETGNLADDRHENIIGTFTAKLDGGKLTDMKGRATSASFDKDLNLMQVHVVAPGADGSKGKGPAVTMTIFPSTMRVHTKYSLRVRTFALRDKANPKLKASWVVWDASASVWMHYLLAMVVPTGPFRGRLTPQHKHDPKPDKALSWLKIWAGQWKRHQPEFREVFTATTLPCPPNCYDSNGRFIEPRIQEADFDNVVSKLGEAAKFAKHGIVALAVGHGDGSSAWFSLAPEDAIYTQKGAPQPRSEYFPSPRVIKHQNFLFLDRNRQPGTVVAVSPNDSLKQKLLNKLGTVFASAPIRLFLLHTCNVGGNLGFLDRIAHETQVYAAGHRDFITLTDPSYGPVQASYDQDADMFDDYQDAMDELDERDKRIAKLEKKLKTADPFEEQTIREELRQERDKRERAKKRADKLKTQLDRQTRHWPLHRASIQAPPNPGRVTS